MPMPLPAVPSRASAPPVSWRPPPPRPSTGPPAAAPADFRYAAFISYSHKEPDRTIAERLHVQLETYRLPKNLIARGYPPRLGRIFRDRDDLAVTPDLVRTIGEALSQSRHLIVICSPNAKASEWIAREVQTFCDMGRAQDIIPVLVAGEPGDAFPAPLLAENGAEHLAADVRAPSRAEALRLAKTEKLRVLARIVGVPYDDLRQRDLERSLRRLRWISSGLVGLVVIAGLAVWEIARERARAQEEARRAELGRLVAEARNLMERSPLESAERIEAAFRLGASSDVERVAREWTRRRTVRALGGFGNGVNDVAWSADGEWVAVASAEPAVRVYNARSWRPMVLLQPLQVGGANAVALSADGARVAVGHQSGHVTLWLRAGGKHIINVPAHSTPVSAVQWMRGAPGEDSVFSIAEDGSIVRLRGTDGAVIPPPLDFTGGLAGTVAWCPRGAWACQPTPPVTPGMVRDLAVSPDGRTVAYVSPDVTNKFVETLPVDGQTPWRLPTTDVPQTVTWLGTGELAVGFQSGAINAIPPGASSMRPVFSAPGSVRRLRAAKDCVAAGTYEGTISVRGLHEGLTKDLYWTGTPVVGLAFAPDGQTLASATMGSRSASVTDWRERDNDMGLTFSEQVKKALAPVLAGAVVDPTKVFDSAAMMRTAVVQAVREPAGDRVAYRDMTGALAIARLTGPDGMRTRTECGVVGSTGPLVWSSDAKLLAVTTQAGEIILYDVDGACREIYRTPLNTVFASYVTIRRDGDKSLLIATSRKLRLMLIEGVGGTWTPRDGPDVGGEGAAPVNAAWSPDGGILFGASVAKDGSVAWFSARLKKGALDVTRITGGDAFLAERILWHPTEPHVIVHGGGRVARIEAASGRRVWTTELSPGHENFSEWFLTADGRSVVALDSSGALCRLDATNGAIRDVAPLGLQPAWTVIAGRDHPFIAGLSRSGPVLARLEQPDLEALRRDVSAFAAMRRHEIPFDYPVRPDWQGVLGFAYDVVPNGARVSSVVADKPAAKAGLKVGDTLLSVDEVYLEGLSDFIMGAYITGPPGTQATLLVRNAAGEKRTLKARRLANTEVYGPGR